MGELETLFRSNDLDVDQAADLTTDMYKGSVQVEMCMCASECVRFVCMCDSLCACVVFVCE